MRRSNAQKSPSDFELHRAYFSDTQQACDNILLSLVSTPEALRLVLSLLLTILSVCSVRREKSELRKDFQAHIYEETGEKKAVFDD